MRMAVIQSLLVENTRPGDPSNANFDDGAIEECMFIIQ